ncbi:MAG: UDP-N-acetylglucosamine 2-epimerase (non-hydrolyzing) [Candidatus Goldbacteria bacterium]|nr:UDP-N-acetylglucosamine 2-epimerase (non-hydrolyzing) [Candidatus Goldiibacteriota bacterium]
MKIAIILGTRPEIIKLSPIIRHLKNNKGNFFIIHTNQHYSYEMDKIFLNELNLPKSNYNLKLNNTKNHGEMVGKMMIEIEKILIQEKPDLVIVQGDTNTTLAGALTGSKLGIKIAHIEAGLRSYDRSMPEEINRVITDHLSDFLFCPTKNQKKILINEGIDKNKIFVVGNTIVDAIFENIKIAEKNKKLVEKYKNTKYFLLTLHRPSNVDNKERLEKIIKILEKLVYIYKIPIIFPIHPRTKINLKKFNINIDKKKIKIINPLGYLEMLLTEKYAQIILTDSGGLQEEACILKVPCLTLRYNTERPETIKVGANILVGNEEKKLLEGIKAMLNKKRNWKNPYGEKVYQKVLFFIENK